MSPLEQDNHGDIDYDREREFCVRDIPNNVDDWAVFHVFKRFGMVENVRFPHSQTSDTTKYCFVTMLSLDGAAKIRSALVGGRLQVGPHALRVSDARGHGPQTKKSLNGRGGGPQPPRNAYQQRRSAEAKSGSGVVKIHIPMGDLPLEEFVSIRVCQSPFPSNEREGLTFHVLNIAKVPGEAYTELQQAMNTHCHNPENACGSGEIGDAMMFYRHEVAYRAIQTRPDTVYLIDMGREERILSGKLFRMLQKFAVLPALVTVCSLARVKWTSPNRELFNSIRLIIKRWCDSQGSLQGRVEYFAGNVNMIHLEGSGNTNLTNSLARRGDLTVVEKPVQYSYSREEMFQLKEEQEESQFRVEIDRHAEAILVNRVAAPADLAV